MKRSATAWWRPLTGADGAPAKRVTPPATAHPGHAAERYGRFRVERRLGHGALGTVALGVDTASGELVALKTFAIGQGASAVEQAAARQRFLAEAATARRLHHPDIVRLVDAGVHDGCAWMALELVRGGDLGRYTRVPRLLPEPLVLRIVARVARALEHAHRQGVLHRDVKPGNVLVDLSRDVVKLGDFGVARVLDAERTRTGVVLGSPAYMAPEQLAGADVGSAADVYALGVLLFELLTGRLPFEAGRSASLGALLRAVAQDPAPGLCSLRPTLPDALAGLVAALLAKAPQDRPADLGALAITLERMAADRALWPA